MRRALATLLLFLPVLSADNLSQRDRDFTLSYLHATRKQLLDATANLTPEQWNFKQADNRWSVAQVVEHLALTEKGLFGLVQKTMATPASAPPADKVDDEMIRKNIPKRDQKLQAPEQFQPAGKFGAGPGSLTEFLKTRDASIGWVRDAQDDLRGHFAPSPLGPLDCVQWMQFIAAHNERHLAQIAEVQADAKYPGR